MWNLIFSGGDLPTRFKYAKVPASSYGMTVDEILENPDKELNKKVGLKRLSAYKHEKTADWVFGDSKKRLSFKKPNTTVSSQNKLKYVRKKYKFANSMTSERIAAYGLDKKQEHLINQKKKNKKDKMGKKGSSEWYKNLIFFLFFPKFWCSFASCV